jgi:glycosyltransferase involved in cell wall biosynthesis
MDTFSPEMANKISEILSTGKYDLVIASQFMMASYHAYFEQVPSIFEEVEVGVLYEQLVQAKSFGQRLRYGLTWAKYRRYLAHLVDRFAACTVVSDQEQRMLRDAVIGDYQPVEIVPNCVDVASYSDVLEGPQANTLIYTGSFTYFANYQAASWFLNQVYPIVQAQVPDVHLTITGNHEDRPIPPAANVTLTGFVDDVRPYVASSWISLAPIWIGGGTRLKILEAMALRTPVVSTSKGIEGLDAKHEKHILVADTPEYFAEAVIRLLQDPGLRQRLTDYAYDLVLERYDWAVVMPRFLSLVERTAYD